MAGSTGGMLSGILSGVIWGSLVGGLVLLLAALLLDLDREPPIADRHKGEGAAGGPLRDVSAEPVRIPAAPDAAPILLQRLAGFLPPVPEKARSVSRTAPDHGLVPRPAQPVLPHLTVGPPVPVFDRGPLPAPGPALALATPGPMRDRLVSSDGGGGPPMIPSPGPPLSVAVPSVPPEYLRGTSLRAVPKPELAGVPPQRIAAAPDATRPPPAVVPPSAAVPPLRAPAMPLADVPVAPGPRVAFILDGASDAPLPDWLRARVMQGDGTGMTLEGGRAVFADPEAAAAFRATRAAGMPALLVYARLDAADAVTLDRIATRARRDGAVAVLVTEDQALWERIGDWLQGPARDLVPVPAGQLLD